MSFAEIVSRQSFSLAEAFLAFAGAEYPGLDPEPYLKRLDKLAACVDSGPAGDLAALGRTLAAAGFRGNAQDYYDPRNSFLNEVLDRGLGIPITLSVVWIETGARAGVDIEGVGMPMHFLVRAGDVLADPFDAGRILHPDDAIAMFGRLTEGRTPWRDEYLAAAQPRDIVRRALHNLKAVYAARSDVRRAVWVEDHLLQIPGAPPAERRERAHLLGALGKYREAIADLKEYVGTEPDDADEAEAEIRRLVAAMN